MTLGEIYARVMWLLYGDTNYPASTQTHMQSMHQGIIYEAHRKIQQDYNYWFMQESTIYDLPEGERVLSLPSDFKSDYYLRLIDYESEACENGLTLTITNSGVMTGATYTIDDKQYLAQCNGKWYWILSQGLASYNVRPVEQNTGSGAIYRHTGTSVINKGVLYKDAGQFYTIEDGKIILNQAYSSGKAVELFYYKYTTPYSPFSDYADNVTYYAADAIIYMAVEIEERRRREFQAAEYYRQLAETEVIKLRREHSQKMLANITIPYME